MLGYGHLRECIRARMKGNDRYYMTLQILRAEPTFTHAGISSFVEVNNMSLNRYRNTTRVSNYSIAA